MTPFCKDKISSSVVIWISDISLNLLFIKPLWMWYEQKCLKYRGTFSLYVLHSCKDKTHFSYHNYVYVHTFLNLFFFFRCMLRVLDSFGTEPEFNHAHYAQSKGHKTPWGKWNLNPQQFYTMFRKYLCACK